MNFRKIIFISLIFLILVISVGSISATGDSNYDSFKNNSDIDDSLEILSVSNEESNIESSVNFENSISDSSASKTITIVVDKTNPNQVLNPTVQPIIDNDAKDGDTIILKGNFVHCHFTINKNLTIIGSKASFDACPHHKHDDVNDFGVFYITEGGSGTVIKGLSFHNDDGSENPFAFLIRGASNVTITDCVIDFSHSFLDKLSGIIIENSSDITLSNLLVNNTSHGIRIINSNNITILNCTISNSDTNAINVVGDSKNINILDNSIINNQNAGINLTSINNVSVINNFIKNNGVNNIDSGSGLYVNSNITKLVVKGNIFLSNGLHGIMYDYRTRNLNDDDGANQLTIVDNNYFSGHSSMILHHRTYVESVGGGFRYDADTDLFISDVTGNYTESKSFSYMLRAFVYADSVCGFTFYTNKIPWALESAANNGKYDFSLKLTNITQIKPGIYEVSIVDSAGNIATDLSSFNVIFYLNNFSTVNPKENETYKSVKIQNGTAIADFTDLREYYLKDNNTITAAFPGFLSNVVSNPYAQLEIGSFSKLVDSNILINNFEGYYNSAENISAFLTDIDNKPLVNKAVSLAIGGKTVTNLTDSMGKVIFSIIFNVGVYDATCYFEGDDIYANCSKTVNITIKKAYSKLISSTLTTFPLSDEYFKVKLTDAWGTSLVGKKVSIKINGKTYYANTDGNGFAKVKLSLTNIKTYAVSIKFAGDDNYGSSVKDGKIVVKTGSKKSKISSSNMKIKRNVKKSFSIKLTSSAGKAISNQKVTVKFNGKTYTVKTNSKGIAKVSIKLKTPKKYKISIKYLGNAHFRAVSKTNTLTIIK